MPEPAGQRAAAADFVCVTFMRLGQVSVVVYILVKGDTDKMILKFILESPLNLF